MSRRWSQPAEGWTVDDIAALVRAARQEAGDRIAQAIERERAALPHYAHGEQAGLLRARRIAQAYADRIEVLAPERPGANVGILEGPDTKEARHGTGQG